MEFGCGSSPTETEAVPLPFLTLPFLSPAPVQGCDGWMVALKGGISGCPSMAIAEGALGKERPLLRAAVLLPLLRPFSSQVLCGVEAQTSIEAQQPQGQASGTSSP